jgi:DNA-binding response OmpR family regulator
MCLFSDLPSILVTDDEPLIRWALVQSFQDAGFAVQQASTVQGALQACASTSFDVLLLDRFLPDGDGLDVLSSVRTSEPRSTVIMMTAQDLPGVEQTALSRGAHQLLIKPLDIAMVLSLVQTVLAAKIAACC